MMGLCASEIISQPVREKPEINKLSKVDNEKSTLLLNISTQLVNCINKNDSEGFEMILKNIDPNDLVTIMNDRGYNVIQILIISFLLDCSLQDNNTFLTTSFCKFLTTKNVMIKTSRLYLHVNKVNIDTNVIYPYNFSLSDTNNKYYIILNQWFKPCTKVFHDSLHDPKELCKFCMYRFKTINLSDLNSKELVLTLFDINYVLGMNRHIEYNTAKSLLTIMNKMFEQEQHNKTDQSYIQKSIQPSAPVYIQPPPPYNEI